MKPEPCPEPADGAPVLPEEVPQFDMIQNEAEQ